MAWVVSQSLTGAAVDGLVEVIAHGVGVRQALEVRRIALLDVVEA
jgi:hypothetical protein